MKIIAQMLRGFGLHSVQSCGTGHDARAKLEKRTFDLIITESVLPDMHSNLLIRGLRQRENNPNRFVPILVLTSYANLKNVTAARDSGAHSVMRKPVSAETLLNHIGWAASSTRPFIEVPNYFGPDRRFRNDPSLSLGRRSGDQKVKSDQPENSWTDPAEEAARS